MSYPVRKQAWHDMCSGNPQKVESLIKETLEQALQCFFPVDSCSLLRHSSTVLLGEKYVKGRRTQIRPFALLSSIQARKPTESSDVCVLIAQYTDLEEGIAECTGRLQFV